MSGALHKAAAAFEQTLRELDVSGFEPAIEDPVRLGRRAALFAAASAIWERQLGPLLDGAQVRELLGVKTRQAVSDLAKRRRLLALEDRRGQLRFPAFQFANDGRPHPALSSILDVFAGIEVSPYTIASWFTTPQVALRRKTPAAWLQAGLDPRHVREAARRTAARLGA